MLKIEDIIAEVEKCEVVCANCHANRTYLRSKDKNAAKMTKKAEEKAFWLEK